jgi:hypothetical protein
MSDWTSAREASRRVKDAGLTGGDLIEWARQGRLRARAVSGTFSSDDPVAQCVFPEEPCSDDLKRSALGPWPDIPTSFWKETPHKALWGAGTFASSIEHFDENNHTYAPEYITLLGVTFHSHELDDLLNGRQPKAATAQPPKERWQQQRATARQRAAFEFLEKLRMFPLKVPLARKAQWRKYVSLAEEGKPIPLGFSVFKKWQDRHADGWRYEGSRWVHNP